MAFQVCPICKGSGAVTVQKDPAPKISGDWHILVHKDKPGKFGTLYYDENIGGYEILEWDIPYMFLDVSVKGDGVIDLDGHRFPEKDWVDYRIQKVSICAVTGN